MMNVVGLLALSGLTEAAPTWAQRAVYVGGLVNTVALSQATVFGADGVAAH